MSDERQQILKDFKKGVLDISFNEIQVLAKKINEEYQEHLGGKIKIVCTSKENILLDIVMALEYINEKGQEEIPQDLQDFYNGLFPVREETAKEKVKKEFKEKQKEVKEEVQKHRKKKEKSEEPRKRPRENDSKLWILGEMIRQKGVDILKHRGNWNKVDVLLENEYIKRGGGKNLRATIAVVRKARNMLRALGIIEKVD